MDERRLGAGLARGLEQVEGADGVGVEIVEGNRRGAIVRGLGGGVDDGVRGEGLDEVEDAGAIADIEFVMFEVGEFFLESALVPAGVAHGAEEDGALVIVESVNVISPGVEQDAYFGTDQS